MNPVSSRRGAGGWAPGSGDSLAPPPHPVEPGDPVGADLPPPAVEVLVGARQCARRGPGPVRDRGRWWHPGQPQKRCPSTWIGKWEGQLMAESGCSQWALLLPVSLDGVPSAGLGLWGRKKPGRNGSLLFGLRTWTLAAEPSAGAAAAGEWAGSPASSARRWALRQPQPRRRAGRPSAEAERVLDRRERRAGGAE